MWILIKKFHISSLHSRKSAHDMDFKDWLDLLKVSKISEKLEKQSYSVYLDLVYFTFIYI